MDFDLTPEQKQLERDVRDYVKTKILTSEFAEQLESVGELEPPAYRKVVEQLGRDRWLGVGWPKEFGGQARSAIEQYIFFDTAMGYYGAPFPTISLNAVGPTLMKVGTDEQKKKFLPALLSGELIFCVGYTEPEHGSDLASLQTKAVKDGDYYVINGNKIFTTQANFADYVWLAARTDPNAPKHKGISIFLVDMKTLGVSVKALNVMGNHRTNYTFYDNVRVHKSCLVGEENKGWHYISNQLGLERIALVCHSRPRRVLDDVISWAKEARLNGEPVIAQPWVRSKLTEIAVEIEILKLLNFRVAWMLTQGTIPRHEPAMIKPYGSEQLQRTLGTALQIFGLYGQLYLGSKWAPYHGKISREFNWFVQLTFGGGASEVLRDVVATVALGLPSSR